MEDQKEELGSNEARSGHRDRQRRLQADNRADPASGATSPEPCATEHGGSRACSSANAPPSGLTRRRRRAPVPPSAEEEEEEGCACSAARRVEGGWKRADGARKTGELWIREAGESCGCG